MTPRRVIIIRINHEGYGCCACQRWHDSGSLTIPRDPNYDAHLWRQSKHGIQTWTDTRCWRIDGEAAPVQVPACQVLVAGEY